MGHIAQLQQEVFDNMTDKGFDTTDPLKKIERVIGELEELKDAIKGGSPAEIDDEMADVFIESLGLAAILGVDAESAIPIKVAINKGRRYEKVDGELRKVEE